MLTQVNDWERTMWLDGIRHFASRLRRARHKSRTLAETARDTPCAVEFDTTWHGDHWQNLLASPLDASHYVMEDWSHAPPPAETEDAALPVRRRRLRYEQ